MHQAVAVAEEVHESAEVDDLDDLAGIDDADLRFGGDRTDPLDRGVGGRWSTAATFTVPSSSRSTRAPVTSQISRMILPPGPMTSRIFSLLMWITVILEPSGSAPSRAVEIASLILPKDMQAAIARLIEEPFA